MGYAGIQKRKTGKANGYGKGDNAASVWFCVWHLSESWRGSL